MRSRLRFVSVLLALPATATICLGMTVPKAVTLKDFPSDLNTFANTFLTNPPASVTSFVPSDVNVAIAAAVTGQQAGDVISVDYVTPSGQTWPAASHEWEPVSLDQLDLTYLLVLDRLPIAGQLPATTPGQWSVKFYYHPVSTTTRTLLTTLNFTISPAGGTTCSYTLSSTSASAAAAGGSGSVNVTAASGCSWTAASNSTSWLTVTSGASGSGNGTVNYSVAANTASTSRSGTVTIAGQTFTVTQAAGAGSSGANLLTNAGFEQPGGGDRAGVTGSFLTGWTISRGNVDYLGGLFKCSEGTHCLDLDGAQAAGGVSQTFATIPGTTYEVNFDLAGNPAGATIKQLRVQAAGQSADFTFDVTGRTTVNMGWVTKSWAFTAAGASTTLEIYSLDAAGNFGPALDNVRVTGAGGGSGGNSCYYTLAPSSQTMGGALWTGAVAVTAPPGCAWTAVSKVSWITVTSGASGSGNGMFYYTVAANPDTTQRTGTIAVMDQTFTVLQTGSHPACNYIIGAGSASAAASGGSGTVSVSAESTCTWTAVSNNSSWLTVTSGATGSGNGTVAWAAAANASSNPRTGTITIAGYTFTVTQAGASTGATVNLVRLTGGSYSGGAFSVNGSYWDTDSHSDRWVLGVTEAGAGNPLLNASNKSVNISPGTYFTYNEPGPLGSAAQVTIGWSDGRQNDVAVFSVGSLSSATGWTRLAGSTSISLGSTGLLTQNRVGSILTATSGSAPDTVLQLTIAASGGVACSYSLGSTSQAIDAGGGSGSVSVSAGAGCSWSAVSNASWIAIASGASGSGNGTVAYVVSANTGTTSRAGTITIGGQTFTVTQAGVAAGGTTEVVLKVDGGTFDRSIGFSQGLQHVYFMNRLTPSSYPATLKNVQIYFGNRATGLSSGTPIAVVWGTASGGGNTITARNIATQPATVGALGSFSAYSVSPLTIASGDFLVGFMVDNPPDIYPADVDTASPSQQRSYYSSDGSSFGLLDAAGMAGNLAIRATVTLGSGGGGGSCTYKLQSPAINVMPAASTGSLAITTQDGCPWTAVSNASWITITSATSGTGTTIIFYKYETNSGRDQRQGTITVAGQTYYLNQIGMSACSFSLDQTSATAPAAGITGFVHLETSAGCPYSVVPNVSWIAIASSAAEVANGVVEYVVAPYTGTTPRTGTITIAGLTFTITQASICNFSISPASTSAGSAGGTGSVSVSAASACSWTAVSNASWITITSGSSGSGNGTVRYSVDAGTATRTGTATIATQTFRVTQSSSGGTGGITLKVDAKSNLFAAGRATAFDGILPPSISLSAASGSSIGFSGITGSWTCSGSTTTGPEGGNVCGGATNITSYQGVSGIIDTKRAMFLAGVFLSDAVPADPAPARLDFSSNETFTTLSPQLGQTFFIGDGLTGNGTGDPQEFVVPAGATRLFLGVADGYNFTGAPGYYSDNGGSVTVAYNFGGGGGGGGGGTGQNLLTNGSFEQPGGGADKLGVTGSTITGWTVNQGNVDYIRYYFSCWDGDYCLDMDGTPGAGRIAQTFATTPGATYTVSFHLAGNPGSGPAIKQLRVAAAGQSADFSFDITGHSAASMGWTAKTWSFTANSASTVLELSSLLGPNSNYGPALDNVRVTEGGGGGAGCTFTISPTSASAPASGGTGSVAVTAASGCTWTAATTASWITVTSGASGSGNETVAYTVTTNSGEAARTGTVTIAGQTYTVTQSGAAAGCTFGISPQSATIGASAGSGSVTVTTATGCSWTASSNASWISLTSGSSGSGVGTLKYATSANAGTSARTGTLTVASQTFTLNQSAVPAGTGPVITDSGVLNGADFTANFAPGSLIAIFGYRLAAGTAKADAAPLPATLGGVSVEVLEGSKVHNAPLVMVTPDQVSAQLPFGMTASSVQVSVRNAQGVSNAQTIAITPHAPRIFTQRKDGTGDALLFHSDDTLVTASSPAAPGETLKIHATGLGDVSPAVDAGQPGGDGSAAHPWNLVEDPVVVLVNGISATVIRTALTPGVAGMYEIIFQMPGDVPMMQVAIRALIGEQGSQSGVTLTCNASWSGLATTSVGAEGGTVTGPNFSLAIPAGAFANTATINLNQTPAGAEAAADQPSPTFGLVGLPAQITSPTTVTITLAEPPATPDEVYIVLQQPGSGPLYLKAEVDGTRVSATIPPRHTPELATAAESPLAASRAGSPRADELPRADLRFVAISVKINLRMLRSDSKDFVFLYSVAKGLGPAMKMLANAVDNVGARLDEFGFTAGWNEVDKPVMIYVDPQKGYLYDHAYEWWGQVTPSKHDGWSTNFIRQNYFVFDTPDDVTPYVNRNAWKTAHLLVHLIQDAWYPPTAQEQAGNRPWLWMDEASATAFEWLAGGIPPTQVSVLYRPRFYLAVSGLEFAATREDSAEAETHGWGASSFLLGLNNHKALGDIYQARKERNYTPVQAIRTVLPLGTEIADQLVSFSHEYPQMLNETVANVAIKLPFSGGGPSVSLYAAQDLSVKFFMLEPPEKWPEGTPADARLSVTASIGPGAPAPWVMIFQKKASDGWDLIAEGASGGEIDKATSYTSKSPKLMVLVANRSAVSPFQNFKLITLTVKATGAQLPNSAMDEIRNSNMFRVELSGAYLCNRTGVGGGAPMNIELSNWVPGEALAPLPTPFKDNLFEASTSDPKVGKFSMKVSFSVKGAELEDVSVDSAHFQWTKSDPYQSVSADITITKRVPFVQRAESNGVWYYFGYLGADLLDAGTYTYTSTTKDPKDGSVIGTTTCSGFDPAWPKVIPMFQIKAAKLERYP